MVVKKHSNKRPTNVIESLGKESSQLLNPKSQSSKEQAYESNTDLQEMADLVLEHDKQEMQKQRQLHGLEDKIDTTNNTLSGNVPFRLKIEEEDDLSNSDDDLPHFGGSQE